MRTQKESSAAGLALLFTTLLGWSSVPLFLKYFTFDIHDAWTTNGWRYGMSALFWAPLLIVEGARGRLPNQLWRAALVPALFNLLAQICFAWAPYMINPGLLAFLLRLQIVFIAFGAYALFPPERPLLRTSKYLAGVGVVFAGMVGLIFLGEKKPHGATATGVALGIAAGLLYGAYFLAVRHFVRGINSAVAFGAISLYTAMGLIPLMLIWGEDHGMVAWKLPASTFALLFVSAMTGIAITHATYYSAIARLGLAFCASIILLQPFIVSVGSFFLFHERLTVAQWCSGLFAMFGAALMIDTQRRRMADVQKDLLGTQDMGGFPANAVLGRATVLEPD
ncbi:MAG: DMT family transporter [Planctomycetes bacterium]|nr:DMT family transporter [Planctomycetota bacterium]MBI3835586.1 DMT family transporter [Planctomycetota bacterium]